MKWILLIALVGCDAAVPTEFGVNLTVDAGGVDQRETIARIRVFITGAESFTAEVAAAPLRTGELRVRYLPGVTAGLLRFFVDALDGNGTVVASGRTEATLIAGQAVNARVTLGASSVDLGMDDLGEDVDLSSSDGTLPDDDLGSSADLAPEPDLLPPAPFGHPVASSGSGVALYDTWGPSANDIYVVGHNVIVHATDGENFNPQTLPSPLPRIYAIWGSAADDIYAVGENGLILHSTGNKSFIRRETTRGCRSRAGSPPPSMTSGETARATSGRSPTTARSCTRPAMACGRRRSLPPVRSEVSGWPRPARCSPSATAAP
jgi:hypothetical protein